MKFSKRGAYGNLVALSLLLCPALSYSAPIGPRDILTTQADSVYEGEINVLTIPIVTLAGSAPISATMSLLSGEGPAVLELLGVEALEQGVELAAPQPASVDLGSGQLLLPVVSIADVDYSVELTLINDAPFQFRVDAIALIDRALDANSSAYEALEGVYVSKGYGLVLQVDRSNDTVLASNMTAVSCTPHNDFPEAIPLSAFIAGFSLNPIDENFAQFSARAFGASLNLNFTRVDELPAPCLNGGSGTTNSPFVNFDAYWQTFQDYFPFFESYGVDWTTQRDTFRAMLTPSTNSTDLFQILSAMTQPFSDEHVRIEFEGSLYNAGETEAFFANIAKSESTAVHQIIESILDEGYAQDLDGKLRTGTIGGEIGYLQLNTFETDDLISLDGQSDEAKAQAYLAVVDSLMANPNLTEGVIVDVRGSSGGSAVLALALAGRFTSQLTPAFHREALYEGQLMAQGYFNVAPSGTQQFIGPVAVLTGPVTLSAAEAFALAMSSLPNVRSFGESTQGSLNFPQVWRLPNGFTYSWPSDTLLSADNQAYQEVGVPPDVLVPVFSDADIALSKDSALEAAIEYIQQN